MENINAPLDICVSVTMHKGKPAIQLRKFSIDNKINEALILAALKNQNVLFKLVFRKPHLQIGNCIDKGILTRDPDGSLRFVRV